MRVLIIDDHPLFREGLKGLLQGLDPAVDVSQAASVTQAQALCEQHFDLVLMDLQMPGASGMDALMQIKALFDASAVVVVSGDESPAMIQSAIHHGAAGYVPKSTDPGVTTHALRLVLAQGIYLPPEALRAAVAPGPAAQSHDGVTPTPFDGSANAVPEATQETSPRPNWTQSLSKRQLAVLRCLLQGKPNKVIAREIGIAEGTVKAHLWAVYQLLGVNNRAQAMYRAHELKLFGVLDTSAG